MKKSTAHKDFPAHKDFRIWKLISQPRHIFAHIGPEFPEAEVWVSLADNDQVCFCDQCLYHRAHPTVTFSRGIAVSGPDTIPEEN
jgi:hypothetical protein